MAAGRHRLVRARRLVLALLALQVLVLCVALVAWLLTTRDQERVNAVNEGLRGSRPPAGRSWPDLQGVMPRPVRGDGGFPDAAEVRGRATMLLATCLDCRSGDIIGGFLGRFVPGEVPEGAQVVVLGWGGDPDRWARRWNVRLGDPTRMWHVAGASQVERVRRLLGVGPVAGAEESGIAYLHDSRARWRSTFFIGQLDRGDVRHDLATLSD